MTRFSDDSDFIDPRMLANQNDGLSVNIGANGMRAQVRDYAGNGNPGMDYSQGQPQFSEYRMPPVAGRMPGYGNTAFVGPGSPNGDLINPDLVNGQATGALAQSIRNQQMALSMEMPVSYSNSNYGRPVPIPGSNLGGNWGNNWEGNQNGQGQYFREMQMRRQWEQQQAQEQLYLNATTARFDPRLQNFDNGSWQAHGRHRPHPIYRPVQEYPPNFQPNYQPDRHPSYQYDPRMTDRQDSRTTIYVDGQPGDGTPVRPLPGPMQRRSARGHDDCDDYSENSFNDGRTVPIPYQGSDSRSRGVSDRPARGASGDTQLDSRAASPYDAAVFNHLKEQAQALVGHSIQEFDPTVPVRLGCARAVSLLVNKGYGFPVKDQAIANLEQTLRKDGFTQVAIKDMQPGDVICGYRAPGDYPHGAVFMGNGMIFNNDSDSGVMQIQSIVKYNKSDFKRFVILRRPSTVPAMANDGSQGS